MGRKTSWLIFIFVIIFVLVGCEANREKQTNEGEKSGIGAGQIDEKQIAESESNEDESDATNIQLSGEVVNENGKIVVKGKSNLIEGAKVEIDWLDRPFPVRNPICLLCEKISNC